jgi:hypothetical protein
MSAGLAKLFASDSLSTLCYRLSKGRRGATSWNRSSSFSPYSIRHWPMKDDTKTPHKLAAKALGWNRCYQPEQLPVIQDIEPYGDPLFEPVEICETMSDEERRAYEGS